MDCGSLLSDRGEAEYKGETFILIARAANLSGVDNTLQYFAAVNKRAVFPSPVVIIPVGSASVAEAAGGLEEGTHEPGT